ncbi:MAG: hypothetical protein WD042_00025 [Phycisphaeraceae bacterium]
MKNAATHAKRFDSLIKPVRKQVPELPAAPGADPVTQLVIGFLEWNASRAAAETALAKLMHVLVDNNDLRVSHPHEVIALIGERYPRADERAARLHDVLQSIFDRQHLVSLDTLKDKSKKDVRAYLDSLPGIVPYVSAQTALLGFGVHAIPVDDAMLALLEDQGAVEEGATVIEAESFLEKHVKAGEAVEVHHAMRAWADTSAGKPSASRSRSAGKSDGRAGAARKPKTAKHR